MSKKRRQPNEPRPPRTAYDTMQLAVPPMGDLVRRVARALRTQHGFDSARTFEPEDIHEAGVREFLEDYVAAKVYSGWDSATAEDDGDMLGVHLHYAINYEAHLRKTFWVDPPLAWALHQTNLDIPGELLRLPFPCCAFVFNDADTLAMANALFEFDRGRRPEQPTRVVTTYLMDATDVRGVGRGLHVYVCLDSLDGRWPYIIGRDLRIDDARNLDTILDSHFPDVDTETLDPLFRSAQLKAVLHLAFNAVLYATSAGVEVQTIASEVTVLRKKLGGLSGRPRRKAEREIARFINKATGEDVFFLPGKIDIKQVERFQAVERAGGSEDGRKLMTRFMVRGHWRRPGPSWKEQRPIWIGPYWKGPDLATIIERDYRLKG